MLSIEWILCHICQLVIKQTIGLVCVPMMIANPAIVMEKGKLTIMELRFGNELYFHTGSFYSYGSSSRSLKSFLTTPSAPSSRNPLPPSFGKPIIFYLKRYPYGMKVGDPFYECLGEPKNEDFTCSDSLSFEVSKYKTYISDHRHYFDHKVYFKYCLGKFQKNFLRFQDLENWDAIQLKKHWRKLRNLNLRPTAVNLPRSLADFFPICLVK